MAARYDAQRVSLSRVTGFTPRSTQEVTETFTNTTGSTAPAVRLSISAPTRWTALASGATNTSVTFVDPVASGASVSAAFKVTSPATTGAGFLTGKAEWTDPATPRTQF